MAVISNGGKQYIAKVGEFIYMDNLNLEEGSEVVFDSIFFVGENKDVSRGTSSVKVTGVVVKNGKQKKIRVFKYNPKKGYRKHIGHRQQYSKVEITNL